MLKFVYEENVLGGIVWEHCSKCYYMMSHTGWSKKTVPQFYVCDNFRKYTPILTIFSLLEPEIYDA